MWLNGLLVLLLYVFCTLHAQAQNTDDQYREPLISVLNRVQTQYGVKIKYDTALVKDRWVLYAQWRFRPNVDSTLNNILLPLDLKVNKEKDKVYKLKAYEYYRRTPPEGVAEINRVSALYHNKDEWEKRKAELKPCILAALQLSPLPSPGKSKPIVTPKRVYDGYTVENVALEVLPGVYVSGSLYKPAKIKGKIPVILNPDGHWQKQRYRPDCQIRCAALARMGAMAFSYDLFAWGESLLQFPEAEHRRPLAMTVQVLSGIRILDYLLAIKEADTTRVGVTGGSGGGTHTVLLAALDSRIQLSVPVVSMSSYFFGGCPCESGMPVHFCGGGTNNVEIGAMAAPKPQLVISDGGDWTDHMPETDFPYLQKMYSYYGATANIENVHLPNDKHDYGLSKREPMYSFIAKHFNLNLKAITGADGKIDESKCVVEEESLLYTFGKNGELLPANAIKGYDALEKLFSQLTRNQ